MRVCLGRGEWLLDDGANKQLEDRQPCAETNLDRFLVEYTSMFSNGSALYPLITSMLSVYT